MVVVATEHTCSPSTNPRHQSSCVECGRLLPPPLARNPDREQTVLKEAAAGAERQFGVRCDAFQACVTARLDMGQARYGDKWKTMDFDLLLREALEECHDLPAWVLLAAEKLWASPLEADDSKMLYAFEAVKHAAAADFYVRMFRHGD